MKSLDFSSNEPFEILMFGDNAQHDAVVYSNLAKELNLNARIYIRDVRTNATFFDTTLPVERISGVNYYFSEVELFKNAEFDYLSSSLLARTYDSYKNNKLIPNYTFKTLNRRLDELYKDKERARSDASKYWSDYYSRF